MHFAFVPAVVVESAVAQAGVDTMSSSVPSNEDANDSHSENYRNLGFTRGELAEAMSEAYGELIALVTSDAFRTTYKEMCGLPPQDRPRFVRDIFLDAEERRNRGIVDPPDVLVQTSAFGDRRPTLFVVKKFLPERFHGAWENVNLTFDNEFADEEISRDPAIAWRKPLPVDLQNSLISEGLDRESIPDISDDDPTWSIGLGESTKPQG